MRYFALVLLIVAFSESCKENNLGSNSSGQPTDSLTEETLTPGEDSILASIQDTVFKPSDLYFSDGQSYEDYAKNNDTSLISNWGEEPNSVKSTDAYKAFNEIIANRGTYYTTISNFHKGDEGDNKPPQDGLAYVLNNDNNLFRYDIRYKNGNCSNLLYGFECNGFVSRLFMDAGVMKSRYTTADLSNPETYNKLFALTTDYKDLKYE